jgi:hypothetical protein
MLSSLVLWDIQDKVIGYFAYYADGNVFCDGDACVIAHSLDAMKKYLNESGSPVDQATIKKTRFGEVIQGMQQGAPYAFDNVAYTKFNEQALRANIKGIPQEHNFTTTNEHMHFIRLKFIPQ